MQVENQQLPHWDLTPIFPSLESTEFEQEFTGALSAIGELATLFDRYNVRRRDNPAVDAQWVEQWEEVIQHLNALRERLRTLGSYLGCFVTTDAR